MYVTKHRSKNILNSNINFIAESTNLRCPNCREEDDERKLSKWIMDWVGEKIVPFRKRKGREREEIFPAHNF